MASPAYQARDAPQIPDLGIIVRSFQAVATELPKFHNVPAFDQGAEILNEMRRMNEKIGRIEEKVGRIEEKVERIEENMGRFDVRFRAMEVNSVARLVNRSLTDPDGQLSFLHNAATNEPINRFPATPRAIKDMPGAALNMVLRALGLETDGGMEQRRQRLRVQIGLKADPL